MSKVTIYVQKAFNLLLNPNDAAQRFEVGIHEVETFVAEHWFVQQHLQDSSAPADIRTPREAADAARAIADAAMAEWDRLEAIAKEAEALLTAVVQPEPEPDPVVATDAAPAAIAIPAAKPKKA